jgi:hypothetical protein
MGIKRNMSMMSEEDRTRYLDYLEQRRNRTPIEKLSEKLHTKASILKHKRDSMYRKMERLDHQAEVLREKINGMETDYNYAFMVSKQFDAMETYDKYAILSAFKIR